MKSSIASNLKKEVAIKRSLQRSKSDSNLSILSNDLKHNEFFNHKRKVAYETHLAQLFLTHLAPFMGTIKKVSNLIIQDIKRMAIETGKNKDSTSTRMHQFFVNDFDLRIVFKTYNTNINQFYEEIISVLNSSQPEYFYKQMCIQRAYITFFTDKGKAKPELYKAVEEKWTSHVDLEKLLTDTKKFRKDEIYFKNFQRIERPHVVNKTSANIGILPPDDYKCLPLEDRQKLQEKLPIHKPAMLQYIITTQGHLSASGMHDYDMPQLCGPSGNTAMRLALANQAKLDSNEKKIFIFAISLFHVAIGIHSIDECFMIGCDSDFNCYTRGDYTSIIPEAIKNQIEFHELWTAIQLLNKRYTDILLVVPSNSLVTMSNSAKVSNLGLMSNKSSCPSLTNTTKVPLDKKMVL